VDERDVDEKVDAVVQAVDGKRRRGEFEDREFELESSPLQRRATFYLDPFTALTLHRRETSTRCRTDSLERGRHFPR
jgi:hypothetical protein